MTPAWFEEHLDRSAFLVRWPGFAGLLALARVVDASDAVPVMAVGLDRPLEPGRRLRLMVSRAYFERHPEHFEGCLLHELHHVAYGHLDDERLHRVEQPRWMELAMEFAANEDVTSPLPPAFRWQDFAEFGMAAGQTTAERYGLLVEAAARGELQLLDEDELDERFPGWRERVRPGSAGSRVVAWPNTPRWRLLDAGRVDDHRPGRCRGGRGLGDALDGCPPAGPRRGGLSEPDLEASLLRYFRAVRSWVAKVDAEPGLASREEPRPVHSAPARIEWAEELRRIRGDRSPLPTWSRPPRRFPDRVGEVPGRVRRPADPRVLAAIDTSASMRPGWLDRTAAEIERLSRVARVTVAEADTRVHRMYPARPVAEVRGGGDTDLRAVFGVVGSRFDAVVCFTDGRGPWPEVPPPVPVVWALFGEVELACPWGRQLRL